MLTRAGYPYLGQLKDGAQVFYNREKRLAYILSPAENDGQALLEIMVIYMNPTSGGSSIRYQLDHRRAVRSLRDELRQLSELHQLYRLRRRG